MPRLPKHHPIPLDSFGFRLAGTRQYMGGWNVKRTADYCGIDDQRWRNWEAGTHRPQDYPSVCRQIADALRIDFRWLMLGSGEVPLRNRCLSDLAMSA